MLLCVKLLLVDWYSEDFVDEHIDTSPTDDTLAAIARYFAALDENEVPGIFLVMLWAMILLLLLYGGGLTALGYDLCVLFFNKLDWAADTPPAADYISD